MDTKEFNSQRINKLENELNLHRKQIEKLMLANARHKAVWGVVAPVILILIAEAISSFFGGK